MHDASALPLSAILEVRDNCLCLATQRAARRLARRFDRALQPTGLTNGQYSLMMFVAGAGSQSLGGLAERLAMDRTTVTALIKTLERRGLVAILEDNGDRRRRGVTVTDEGREALRRALPIWRREHAALEASLPDGTAPMGRDFLRTLADAPLPV